MFQNLADEKQEDYIEEQNEEIENKKKINLKELFSVSNIILYAISFMASMVSFGGEFIKFINIHSFATNIQAKKKISSEKRKAETRILCFCFCIYCTSWKNVFFNIFSI